MPARMEDLPLPFQGEEMECFECGRRETSDPNVESGWYSFTMEGKDARGQPFVMRLYWCGGCRERGRRMRMPLVKRGCRP